MSYDTVGYDTVGHGPVAEARVSSDVLEMTLPLLLLAYLSLTLNGEEHLIDIDCLSCKCTDKFASVTQARAGVQISTSGGSRNERSSTSRTKGCPRILIPHLGFVDLNAGYHF